MSICNKILTKLKLDSSINCDNIENIKQSINNEINSQFECFFTNLSQCKNTCFNNITGNWQQCKSCIESNNVSKCPGIIDALQCSDCLSRHIDNLCANCLLPPSSISSLWIGIIIGSVVLILIIIIVIVFAIRNAKKQQDKKSQIIQQLQTQSNASSEQIQDIVSSL